ncbi:MAG: hypothetical protein H8E82_01245 [Candidatus Marinimicrobia bacterium]|nr:hypothetical protein [Candidatus Neomarinimicrobiota bacterium]
MKKITVTFILLFMIIPLTAQNQYESDFWLSLDMKEKVIFLQGVYKGLTKGLVVMENEVKRQEANDPFWRSPFVLENSAATLNEYFSEKIGYDYEQIAVLLDLFYSNSDNTHIDLMYALRVIMLHQDGEQHRANELLLIKQKEVLEGR